MTFAATPIAVIGRGAVLPGALDPAALWRRVLDRDDLTGPSTSEQWGLNPASVCADPLEPSACARGGYVTGFDSVWTDAGLRLEADALAPLPVGWRWLIHATRQALNEAAIGDGGGERSGLVLGSLGYPSRAFAEACASRWCDPGSHRSAGLQPSHNGGTNAAESPALEGQTGALHWTMRACGLAGPRLAIDAACASGLYALKLACDLLHSRRADVMVAAGLNAADDLFLHIGFTALSALSRSGRSSPLSSLADGLLPAEGAAALVIKRLDDAISAGDPILGIVRGVGLSNDGRGAGLLSPSSEGQQQAILAAYRSLSFGPAAVDYLECHATGTFLGDREEILSVRETFGPGAELKLGSLKAQLGHLITASATAGLLKILAGFEHGILPAAPQVSIDSPMDLLQDCGLELPPASGVWLPTQHPRRAAINAFGFGGCNAHAVLEGPEAAETLLRSSRVSAASTNPAWNDPALAPPPEQAPAEPSRPLALVACELAVGDASDTNACLRVLLGLDPATRRLTNLDLPIPGLGFPPTDLRQTLPQQLLLLRAALALRPQLEGIDRQRLGVYIGADIDPAGARHGCRWRLANVLGRPVTSAERDGVVAPLQAAGVLGTMPNMPANRLNSLLDARGPGFVVSDGPASGQRALACAAEAMANDEIDAALVGAVEASGGAFGDDPLRADTVLLLLLLPADQVGDRAVLALLESVDPCQAKPAGAGPAAAPNGGDQPPQLPWPSSGVAQGLLEIAVAALCCRHALWPRDPAQPWVTGQRQLVLHGWRLWAPELQGLAEEAPSLAIPAAPTPSTGELAWVFTGAAAAYPGAGRVLLRAFPELGDALMARAPRLASSTPALLAQTSLSLLDQLHLATLLSQSHALLLGRLGVKPDACLGLSSGETNSYMASGAWSDIDELFHDVSSSGMYDHYLAGDHATLRQAWQLGPEAPLNWRCYRIVHPQAALEQAVKRSERVRILIVHHPGDAVIGGEQENCLELIAQLGASAVPIDHDLLVHCPELEPFAPTWWQVHHRPTHSFGRPRLYANAINDVFEPDADLCADMLTNQARGMVRFHPTVERAYADGVCSFVELGPRSACTGWIHTILAHQAHLAVAIDGSSGSLRDLAAALSAIAAAGHQLDDQAWTRWIHHLRLLPPPNSRQDTAACVHLGGHLPQPLLAPVTISFLQMPLAPSLAASLPDRLRPVEIAAAALPTQAPTPAGPAAAPCVLPQPLQPLLESGVLQALANCQEALLQAQALTMPGCASMQPAATPQVSPTPVHTHGNGHAVAAASPTPLQPILGGPPPTNGAQPRGTAPPRPVTPERAPQGLPPAGSPTFSRAELEIHAGGRISEIFGPAFVPQDDHRRQVRMPMAPLLLADRVTGLVGEPATMGTGCVWTETDIKADSWYLDNGRMPTGILIESGQADLFLISWLGIDLLDRGERVYRLLGCELTFHGGLPGVGDTLRYEIHIDSHARHGDIGLFFFHYDCWSDQDLRLSVRDGQAGFFSDAELAESAGVLWNPADDVPDPALPCDPPRKGVTPADSYDETCVEAFAAGDLLRAFGPAFVRAASHTRPPRIPQGQMRLFDRVEALDIRGGHWGRGYLRAVLDIQPDQWFFPGHFKNDPCMPGTLMFEGCLQTLAFYMSALGYSIDRDGWRFEPAQEQPFLLRCRGQVTPRASSVVYELFVAEVRHGSEPRLVADLTCTVDGLLAFHCRRMALCLVPDVPFSSADLAAVAPDREPVVVIDGFRFGQASLLACANGAPVAAFGALYGTLPASRRVPRLPAPPYHFISRVTSLSQPPGGMQAGVTVETAYDIPASSWYFAAHPSGLMPACVLIEAALQPCGWLASYVGVAVHEADEVFFRNLDGAGVLHRALRPSDRCLRVRSHLKSFSRAGGMTLVGFEVTCTVTDEVVGPESEDGETVYTLSTTFGFFPGAALEAQAGLPASEAERQRASSRGDGDLLDQLPLAARARLPKGMLRMCERVTERQLAGDGTAYLRGEKEVRPGEWFFRAHFYQDPVQPGSLGVEALVQLLQAHLLLEGAVEAMPSGEFADMVGEEACTWQFRGQVLPENERVSLTLEAGTIRKEPHRWSVTAQGSVWVDGQRIYQVRGLSVSFAIPAPLADGPLLLDPARQSWWLDHRPTFGPPVLPGMAAVSLALEAVPGAQGLDDFVLRRWVLLDRPRRLEASVQGERIVLSEAGQSLAEGRLWHANGSEPVPAPLPPLPDSAPAMEDPYASGELFHGPAYQRWIRGRRDASGADLVLRLDPEADRRERISHLVLDAALHGVPHDRMHTWFEAVAEGQVAYPAQIERFRSYAPLPVSGTLEVRVRPMGVRANAKFPRLQVQWLVDETVLAEMHLVEACFPATRLGSLPPADRRAFLRDGVAVPGARLSESDGGVTRLSASALAAADWLPGTVASTYQLEAGDDSLVQVAAREHAAATLALHPRQIMVDATGRVRAAALPLLDYHLTIEAEPTQVTVQDRTPPRLDGEAIHRWWDTTIQWQSQTPSLRPLFMAACAHFVGEVRLLDPDAIQALAGRPVLLVANHQVAIESVLAGIVLPPVLGLPLLTLAKLEHADTWVGQLAMGLNDERHGQAILYVERDRQQDMLDLVEDMARATGSGSRSLMLHVEGTRATRGGQPVTTLSGVWADLAVQARLPIVPLRFCAGLPAAGTPVRQDFPCGFGPQSLVLGQPLLPTDLAQLPLNQRRERILEALAELEAQDREPTPDPAFGERVQAAISRWGLDPVAAVFLLLQAEARHWSLDHEGLPAEAMQKGLEAPEGSDPFWHWLKGQR